MIAKLTVFVLVFVLLWLIGYVLAHSLLDWVERTMRGPRTATIVRHPKV